MDTVKICGVKAKVAKTLFERMKGLIGTKCLRPGEGMLILKCNSIHTFFMRHSLTETATSSRSCAIYVRGVFSSGVDSGPSRFLRRHQ